ncbi:uncharacterized protein LOC142229497 [Haematobia irritans]|uniref:uncharacterized protein LOC142229497 n=1 Tax=Haematobia irritans TaxID=7368 RepID=UPI003F4F533D
MSNNDEVAHTEGPEEELPKTMDTDCNTQDAERTTEKSEKPEKATEKSENPEVSTEKSENPEISTEKSENLETSAAKNVEEENDDSKQIKDTSNNSTVEKSPHEHMVEQQKDCEIVTKEADKPHKDDTTKDTTKDNDNKDDNKENIENTDETSPEDKEKIISPIDTAKCDDNHSNRKVPDIESHYIEDNMKNPTDEKKNNDSDPLNNGDNSQTSSIDSTKPVDLDLNETSNCTISELNSDNNDDNTKNTTEDNKENSSDIPRNQDDDSKASTDDSAKPQESHDEIENTDSLNCNNSEINEDAVDDEGDGEYEDVMVPDGDEELIVPDETENGDDDDDEGKSSNDEDLVKKNKQSKSLEEDESSCSALEPELVAIEEAKEGNILGDEEQTHNNDETETSNSAANDPLNCLGSQEVDSPNNNGDSNISTAVGEDSNTAANDTPKDTNDDDDDEVQFIETRNSPICIESDDDEPPPAEPATESPAPRRETRSSVAAKTPPESNKRQTINLPSSTITVPKNLTVTRTSARKSTSRPPQFTRASTSPHTIVPQTSNNNKHNHFQYLNKATTFRRSMPGVPTNSSTRKVVDTIELLDSSDEEGGTSRGSGSSGSHNRSLPPKFGTPPKRTLMAAKNLNKKSPNKTFMAPSGGMLSASSFATQIPRQQRKPAPPPLPPATPQSNFLNAVQLQPATAGINPPAFSALLSNKSVIIPNAFYGNPSSVRGAAEAEMERRYARWLDNFITQFCNPQLVASHACFVFLQKALKYKDFVHIKGVRTSLNMNAQTAKDQLNHQLMLEMRSMFLKSSKEITPHGRRFCELTCSMVENKSFPLLVHGVTNKAILRTCNMEMPAASPSPSSNANSSSASSNNRKRQLEEDEYVPGKNKTSSVAVDNADQSSGDADGPKRSLRSKRAKRLDNSFSYNEDDLAEYDLEDEEEQAERLAREEVQRKIDKKRIEAQRQRQRQAASFESSFLQEFAKTLSDRPPPAALSPAPQIRKAQPGRNPSSWNVNSYSTHNDAEALLTANWIENVENEDAQVISDDDEPREHRIYKKQQQLQAQQAQLRRQQQQQQQQMQRSSQKSTNFYENHFQSGANHVTQPRRWPKNTDINMVVNSKSKDICVVCKLSVQRIVHHYVNEHRGCEVYNSRLSATQLEQLKRGACNIKNMSLYKNGQPQYEGFCVFCQKDSRFMLPYWYQHFTMHTGEYAYRCSGCGVRKPTRSLLTQHQAQGAGCSEGSSVVQDYSHDPKVLRVEARICTLCNYIQLHRTNIVKHLMQQHNIKQILPKHIQTIVLLKDQSSSVPSMASQEVTHTNRRKQSLPSQSSSTNRRIPSYVVDDDDDDTLLFSDNTMKYHHQQQQQQRQEQMEVTQDPPMENHYYNYMPPYMMNQNHENFTWEEPDPSDDLSFMICGMLDVPAERKE